MTQSKLPPTEALAAIINSLREAHGLSTTKLAEAVGITEPTFRRRMRGIPPFDIRELTSVADQLGTTAATLLAQAEDNSNPSAA